MRISDIVLQIVYVNLFSIQTCAVIFLFGFKIICENGQRNFNSFRNDGNKFDTAYWSNAKNSRRIETFWVSN